MGKEIDHLKERKAEERTFKLDPAQYKQLDDNFDGLNGAINKLAARVSGADKNKTLYQAITDGFASIIDSLNAQTLDNGKWQSIQNDSIQAGFKLVAEAIANGQTQPPPLPNKLEVRFVYKVKNNHPDEPFSVSVGGVTDEEGEPLPDASGLAIEVLSSDDAIVQATYDPATGAGNLHFGASGVAAVTASVKNAAGDILGSGAKGFTVTTGDPAAVSDVAVSIPGLTEEPEPEPEP